MAAKRAVREFAITGDPWTAIDEWAGSHGYRVVDQGPDRRLYRRGSGFWAGSRKLEIRKQGDVLHLEVWVAANLFTRGMSLFILPAEITIESGGAKAILPRKMGRNEVNPLLQAFGQQPIA
jgi:hypothetical protein